MEKWLAAYEEKVAGAERCIQQFEHNKDTLEYLITKFEEAEAKLKTSRENMPYIENKLFRQCHKLVEKNASLSEYGSLLLLSEKNW